MSHESIPYYRITFRLPIARPVTGSLKVRNQLFQGAFVSVYTKGEAKNGLYSVEFPLCRSETGNIPESSQAADSPPRAVREYHLTTPRYSPRIATQDRASFLSPF
jgi:hypothetical protein